jgi:hypothetical protein
MAEAFPNMISGNYLIKQIIEVEHVQSISRRTSLNPQMPDLNPASMQLGDSGMVSK